MSLRRITAISIGYNALIRIIMFGFQGITSVILARSLNAADYGIVGFSLIFINFFRSFSDMGLNNALVKGKALDDKAAGTAFILRITLGSFACLIAMLVSIPAANIFGNNEVIPVIRLLAANFLISAFSLLPIAHLKREMDYRRLSIFELSITVVSSAVSVFAALAGYGFWSIVIANLMATFVSTVVANILHPTKIKIVFDVAIARGFLSYGSNIFIAGLVVYVMLNVDNFIVGATAGTVLLGCYAIAFNWGSMVCTVMQGVVLNVLFPTFSRIIREGKAVEKPYLDVVEYISFLAILTNLTLLVASYDFIVCFLGKGSGKWLPALTAFRILCVYGIIRAILEPMGQVILAIGKSELISKATLIAAVVEITLLYPAIKLGGIAGAAMVVTAAYAIQYIYYLRVLKRIINLDVQAIVRRIMPACIAAPAAFLPTCLRIEGLLSGSLGFFVISILSAITYTVAYGVLTRWKILSEFKNLVTVPGR